jgi:hypothetical protein
MDETVTREMDPASFARAILGERPAPGAPVDRERSSVARRPPFPFKMLDELDMAPRKDWLVRRLLGAGEFSVVYGEPGSGKSVLATDLAFHVSVGAGWMGRKAAAGAVIYVAAERSKLTERRLAALRLRNELADCKLAILDGRFDLFADEGDAERLIATAAIVAEKTGAGVSLIILDTVARVIPGADENHSRDMGRFVANVDEIRRATGAHVMAIHHAGKDKSKGMRGSTALLGAADTTIFIEKLESGRFATVDKSNDEGEGESINFALEGVELFVDPETGDATTAPIVVAGENERPVKRKADGLSAVERTVLDCLHAAIDDFGVAPPAAVKVPPSVVKCVDEQRWRTLVYEKTRHSDEDESAARKRFNRAKDKLIASNRIGKAGDYVWSAN